MPTIDEQEDFLRKKIDESAVDYSDQYWQNAKQLLGTKRRRKLGWWWLPVIILLPVAASVSYFGMKGNNNYKQKLTIASTAANDSSPFRRTAIVRSMQSSKPATSAEQTRSATLSSSSSLNKNEKPRQSFITNTAQTNNAASKSTSAISKKETKKIKALTKAARHSAHLNNNLLSKAGKSHIQASMDRIETNNSQNNNPDKENTSADNSTASKLSTDAVNSTVPQSISAAEVSKTSTNSFDTTKPLVKDTALASIPKVVNKVDSVTGNSLPKNNIRNKILAISAGCNFSKGINATGNNSFTVGALPYVSASFAIPLSMDNKAMIKGGLTFNAYNQLHSQIQVHHSNYYSFGYGKPGESLVSSPQPVSDTVFTLNQQFIFTVQLPVVFNYYINGKNSISVGAGVAYTMGVYSKVINFNGTETGSFGYGQGYKPFNAFVQAGYCYNFTSRWGVEINIQQGLTDMTDDNFFNSNRKDRFTNLQVGLKHEFLIKSKKNFYDKK